MTTGLRPNDTEHLYRGSLEPKAPTPEKKRLTLKHKIAVAALALMTATGVGYTANALRQDQPTKTEAPANPGPSATASVEATPSPEASAVDMEMYSNMDIETFNLLPQDERLLYSQYLLDKNVSLGNYDAVYGEGAYRHAYEITPVTVNTDNTGQEILDSNLYYNQIVYNLCGVNDDGSDGNLQAEKALSSVYYKVEDGNHEGLSNSYLHTVEQIESSDSPGNMINKFTATKTSELMVGVDKNDEKVQYKIVTYIDAVEPQQKIYTRFIYHNIFTNYKGEEQALWLIDINADTFKDLENSSTVLK